MEPSACTHMDTFRYISLPAGHPRVRLDRMQAMAEVRRARMAERAAAIKAFYAQLTPEQQKVFDAEGLPAAHRGHHRRHQS